MDLLALSKLPVEGVTGFNRRQFLKLGADLAILYALSRAARAFGIIDSSKFVWAQIIYNGRWNTRPTGGRGILLEVAKRTSVDVSLEPKGISLTDPKLRDYPFLCISGDKEIPSFSKQESLALRAYLTSGGMLFADDTKGEANGAFSKKLKKALSPVFPEKEWKRLPQDHSVFRSFYLLDRFVGRTASMPYLEGLDHEDRTPVILSGNDLLGAWARDEFGTYEHRAAPGGEAQREMAIRMGINVVLYALTVNYKKDQVHQPFILQRKR